MGILDTPATSKKRFDASVRRLSALQYKDAFPAVLTSPPTTAFVTPGGASPVTSPVTVPWTSNRVRALGGTLTKVASFDFGENATNALWSGGVFSVEFDAYVASKVAVRFRNRATNSAEMWFWVDGQPVTAEPELLTANASSSIAYYGLTFAAAGQHRVRCYMRLADFGGVDIGPLDTLSKTRRPLVKMAAIGDSYLDSSTGADFAATGMATTIGRMLGVDLTIHGQGGTGYGNAGAAQHAVYGDSARVAAVKALNPDVVFVVGSQNDDAISSSTIGTAAAALYAALAPIPVLVVGPQATTGNPAGRYANRDAIRTAALAASNVIGFFDPLDVTSWERGHATPPTWTANTTWAVGDVCVNSSVVYECKAANSDATFSTTRWTATPMITGTGGAEATTGGGNSDVMYHVSPSPAAGHPTQAGHDYYARVLAEWALRVFSSLAT